MCNAGVMLIMFKSEALGLTVKHNGLSVRDKLFKDTYI